MKYPMNWLVYFLVGFIWIFVPSIVQAACFEPRPSDGARTLIPVGVRLNMANEEIFINGQRFELRNAQCTPDGRKPDGEYTVWCEFAEEVNALDSVRQPVCGSAPERDRVNSSCWDCVSNIKCDGLGGAIGYTDPYLTDPNNKVAIDNGDVTQVWGVRNPPNTVRYNGQEYPREGRGVILCTANNLACGASEECTSLIDGRSNHGTGEGEECQTYVYTIGAQSGGSPPNYSITQETSCELSSVNTFAYIAPNCGTSCPLVAASAFSRDGFHAGSVANRVEWVNDNCFKQISNNKVIFSCIDGGSIRVIYDTTWENEETCPNTNTPVYQRLYTPANQEGANVYRNRYLSCGGENTYESFLRAYLQDGALDANPLKAPGAQCTAHPANDVTSSNGNKLIFQGRALCNGQMKDLVAFQNTGQQGNGEVFLYGLGAGLVAWYQGIDFANPLNAPSAWGNLDVCSGALFRGNAAPGSTGSYQVCTQEVGGQLAAKTPLGWKADFLNWLGSNSPPVLRDFFAATINQLAIIKPANDDLDNPDHTTVALTLAGAQEKLLPNTIKARVQPIAHELKPSQTTVVCHPNSENAITEYRPDRGVIESALPMYNVFLQGALLLNAPLGTVSLPPLEWLFGQNHPPRIMGVKRALDCNRNDSGDTAQTLNNSSGGTQNEYLPRDEAESARYSNAIIGDVLNRFNDLVSQFINGICTRITCPKLEPDLPGVEVGITSHLPYAEEANNNFANRKGFFEAFTANSKKSTKKEAKVPNDFEQSLEPNRQVLQGARGAAVVYKGDANNLDTYCRGMCSLLPSGKQTTDLEKCDCNEFKVPAGTTDPAIGCSSGTLPNIEPSGSCRLCNLTQLDDLTDDSSLAGGMPPTMQKIIEKAAETYNVPPSSILAAMYHEGAFSGNRYEWTEENVTQWSLCGAQMPNCDRNATDAQFPFGWRPNWFYADDPNNPNGSAWDAVQTIDPSRNSKDLVSPCNFLDGVFATAKSLSFWSAGRPTAAQPYDMCFNLPITSTRAPNSCNSWNDALVFQSHVGYAGQCPEPGKNQYEAQPNYRNWVLSWYNTFRCE